MGVPLEVVVVVVAEVVVVVVEVVVRSDEERRIAALAGPSVSEVTEAPACVRNVAPSEKTCELDGLVFTITVPPAKLRRAGQTAARAFGANREEWRCIGHCGR